MKARDFGTEQAAAEWCDEAAAAFGMPWVGGTDVGGGRHVAPDSDARVTARLVAPTGSKVIVSEETLAALGPRELAAPLGDAAGPVQPGDGDLDVPGPLMSPALADVDGFEDYDPPVVEFP